MKKINFRVALFILVFALCGGTLFAQAGERLKIEPKKNNAEAFKNPQEIPVKPTRKVADAFYDYFGRSPDSKEAQYWNSVEKKKDYTPSQFVSLIKERFTAPKDYTDKEKKAHLEKIKGIIERAYKTAGKPAPTVGELDKWAISIGFGKDWYRTIFDSLKGK